MKAFEIPSDSKSLEQLRLVDRPDPQPGAGQILIGMRAASINARDQSVAAGRYFGGLAHGDIIALSDGAGEVLAAGPGVDRFKRGDRVAGLFAPGWLDGPPLHTLMRKGASIHGIIVGSRAMFERMNQAIAERNIHPVIDKVFAFDKAVDAWRYHLSGAHFGKVVISI